MFNIVSLIYSRQFDYIFILFFILFVIISTTIELPVCLNYPVVYNSTIITLHYSYI